MHAESTTPPAEEWRPVVGYEDLYSVSSLGRVRRDRRYHNSSPDGILTHCLVKGYPNVSLARERTKKRAAIHQLVARAFLGPYPPRHEINHKDGRKANNRVDNLEYTTTKGNRQHASRMGLLATGDRNGQHTHPEMRRRGEKVANARLSDAQVREIRAAYVPYKVTHAMLAARYGVSKACICFIIERRNWKHLAP